MAGNWTKTGALRASAQKKRSVSAHTHPQISWHSSLPISNSCWSVTPTSPVSIRGQYSDSQRSVILHLLWRRFGLINCEIHLPIHQHTFMHLVQWTHSTWNTVNYGNITYIDESYSIIWALAWYLRCIEYKSLHYIPNVIFNDCVSAMGVLWPYVIIVYEFHQETYSIYHHLVSEASYPL